MFSLASALFLNGTGTLMLNYYSTRMAENIYIYENGRMLEVDYFNAFFVSWDAS